jgi:hypothetical protein
MHAAYNILSNKLMTGISGQSWALNKTGPSRNAGYNEITHYL